MNEREMSYEEAKKILAMTAEEVEAREADPAESENEPILGKYGLLARDYLKEYHPGRYEYLLMETTLMDVLMQADKDAREMMEAVQTRLRKETPRPKGNFMAAVQYETAIHDEAEEIVLNEIIFKRR